MYQKWVASILERNNFTINSYNFNILWPKKFTESITRLGTEANQLYCS